MSTFQVCNFPHTWVKVTPCVVVLRRSQYYQSLGLNSVSASLSLLTVLICLVLVLSRSLESWVRWPWLQHHNTVCFWKSQGTLKLEHNWNLLFALVVNKSMSFNRFVLIRKSTWCHFYKLYWLWKKCFEIRTHIQIQWILPLQHV